MAVVLKVTHPSHYSDVPMGIMANFTENGSGFPSGFILCEGQWMEELKDRAPECMILLQQNGFLRLPEKGSIICEVKPYERRDGNVRTKVTFEEAS